MSTLIQAIAYYLESYPIGSPMAVELEDHPSIGSICIDDSVLSFELKPGEEWESWSTDFEGMPWAGWGIDVENDKFKITSCGRGPEQVLWP